MDILFLTLPRLELRCPITAPALLKSMVEKHGFKSTCIDLNLDLWHRLDEKQFGHIWFDTDLTFRYEDKFEQFWDTVLQEIAIKWMEQIKSLNPKWIGITVFSQRSKHICIKLCELIKEYVPQSKIVLGGPGVHLVISDYTKTIIDAYVIGEGEECIVQILKGNLDFPGINSKPPQQIEDLDQLPLPDYSDFDFKLYSKIPNDPRIKKSEMLGTQSIYITGSRGCVRKCDFCDIGSIWPKYRYRSGKSIAGEMLEQSSKYNCNRFLFTDSLINGSIPQLKALCQNLIEYSNSKNMPAIKWQGQFIARSQKQMPEEIYSLMAAAGCDHVSIGIESASEKVRLVMNKQFSNEDLNFTLQMCIKYNIKMSWLLMVGHPAETDIEMQETFDFLTKNRHIISTGLINTVTLGPTLDIVRGSPLFEKIDKYNITYDEFGNWQMPNNNRITRINRWLKLKQHCLDLGYPITEKVTNHLLEELKKYKDKGLNFGPMEMI